MRVQVSATNGLPPGLVFGRAQQQTHAELQQFRVSIAARDTRVKQLTHDIRNKDHLLEQVRAAAQHSELSHKGMYKTVAARDRVIKQLERNMHMKDRTLKQLRAAQETTVQQLQQEISQKDIALEQLTEQREVQEQRYELTLQQAQQQANADAAQLKLQLQQEQQRLQVSQTQTAYTAQRLQASMDQKANALRQLRDEQQHALISQARLSESRSLVVKLQREHAAATIQHGDALKFFEQPAVQQYERNR